MTPNEIIVSQLNKDNTLPLESILKITNVLGIEYINYKEGWRIKE